MKTQYDDLVGNGEGVAKKLRFGNGGALWLFFLFLSYGPAISFVGELRYLEVVVLVLFAINLPVSMRAIGRWEWLLARLFLLTAIMYVVSDIVNGANIENTLKRVFTYIILAILVFAIRFLTRDNIYRLAMILLGYCFSGITQLIVGNTANPDYAVNPWRLGFGVNVTMAIVILPILLPQTFRIAGLLLIIMSLVHLIFEARALSAITMIAGLIVSIGYFKSYVVPIRFKISRLLLYFIFLGVATALMYSLVLQAYRYGALPGELQQKMDIQFSNPYGLLAAGRSETIAAMYGIFKKPLIGFGSTNIDQDIIDINATIAAASYGFNEDSVYQRILSLNFETGVPSHSHVIGAWVHTGIFGAISWCAVIFMSFYTLFRASLWRNRLSPLIIVVSLFVIWDVFFSPGPHRMDAAIRLTIIIYAIRIFSKFDRGNGFLQKSKIFSR